MDTGLNAVIEEQSQVEETDDSCRVDFIEIVPLTRDTDFHAAECVSGNWFGEVDKVDFSDIKQEPDDVCFVLYRIIDLSQQEEFVEIIDNRLIFFLSFQLFLNFYYVWYRQSV